MRNTSAGLYSSHAARATLWSATNFCYLPTANFWKDASIPLLQGCPDLEICIKRGSLSDSDTLTAQAPQLQLEGQLPVFAASTASKTSNRRPTPLVRASRPCTNLVLSAITGFRVYGRLRHPCASSPTCSSLITYNSTLSQFEIPELGRHVAQSSNWFLAPFLNEAAGV